MGSQSFPPVRNLPHWPRVGCLDDPCAPHHPLPTRQVQQLPPLHPVRDGGAARGRGQDWSPHTDTRVASLQRDVRFLQQQHKETLQRLHAEIEDLRRRNKELQYRLIMDPPKSSRKSLTRTLRGVGSPTQGGEAHKGVYVQQPLEDIRPSQDRTCRRTGVCEEIPGSSARDPGRELRGGLITSLQPLRIHSSPTQPPRAPTLQECEVIIRQLYNANSVQSQEILRVKAVLRDIVFNKRITPENYIVTKAYLADGPRKAPGAERFPQLTLQPLPVKSFGPPLAAVTDRVILPALKQSLKPTMAERQKRAQDVQRNRLKRTVR